MATSRLQEAFLHLSQHSVDSVQNGNEFTNWDEYMHVYRPIESKLMQKMDKIDKLLARFIRKKVSVATAQIVITAMTIRFATYFAILSTPFML